MKTIQYLITVLTVLFFALSCEVIPDIVPAEPEPAVKLVPITFSATQVPDGVDDTKATLEGLKIHWTAGDKIAVFDNVDPTTKHEFIASSTGESTSFSGSVSEGATKYFAVYPYSAADNCNMTEYTDDGNNYMGYLNANIPAEQKAVAGGFDPDAAVLAAYTDSNEKALKFRIPFALAKFTVIYDDVKSVSFSSGKNMTGSMRVNMRENGNIGLQDGEGTKTKTLTISNADGSALTKNATYYVVLRYRTGSSAYTDFTVNVSRTGGKTGTATASANIEIARNNIKNLGDFAGMPFTVSRYNAYQNGEDIVIAGKTYNKATDGDATLLGNEGVFKSSNTGLVFLEAGATVTNTSEATITSDVVIASNDPDNPATYMGTSGKSFLLKSGSLVFDSVIIDMAAMTSGQFMTKKDNDQSFTSLTVQQCDIRNVKRPFFTPNSAYLEYGIKSITLNGNRIATGADVQLIPINSGATTLKGYEDFTFTNNVLYSSTGNAQQTYVFATSAAGIDPASCKQVVVMNNNLFYNIAASNGIFRSHTVKSVQIRNNILWAADGSYSSNIKLFKANMFSNDNPATPDSFAGSSSDNYCYGNLGEKKEWSICDSACRGPLTNVTVLDSNPIADFDTSTGEFTLVSEYSAYGPQL